VVEGFDRAADDPFALQNEITSRITYALAKELIASETARPTEHPDIANSPKLGDWTAVIGIRVLPG
jgi:hypothetical protein